MPRRDLGVHARRRGGRADAGNDDRVLSSWRLEDHQLMANFTTKPGVDWPAIRQRYDAGETLTSIAKDAGVTRQGIAERAKKEGWAKPDRPRRQQGQALASIAALPEPDSDRAKMAVLEALHMGSTLKAAAARAGLTVDQLKHWRNRDETFGRM